MRYARAPDNFPMTRGTILDRFYEAGPRALETAKRAPIDPPRHASGSRPTARLPSLTSFSDVPTPWQNTHGPKVSRSREPGWRWVTRTSREVGSRARFEHVYGAFDPRSIPPRVFPACAAARAARKPGGLAPPAPRRRARPRARHAPIAFPEKLRVQAVQTRAPSGDARFSTRDHPRTRD